MDRDAELDRQFSTLVEKGYPSLAGLGPDELVARLEPLRALLPRVTETDEEHLPFVVVVPTGGLGLVPTVPAVERLDVRGKAGWTDMGEEIGDYLPVDGVEPPGTPYLLVGVSTGPETLGVTPADALTMIRRAGRTPLTVDEGIALVTQLPTVLTERNAFQAVGSRAANKRIPSFWISKGAPRLGWCWEGNPHSWLGAASAADRIAP